ncbi:MAG: hypothetical protein RL754_830 [Bacteroidota bacterium]|jgi:hypothetical protein
MEDKIINNVLFGYPFSFPFWRAPLDQSITLDQAVAENKLGTLPGFGSLSLSQQEKAVKNLRRLFAIYASGDRSYEQWTEAKHAVRAFPNSYKEIMGIKGNTTSWLPKLI